MSRSLDLLFHLNLESLLGGSSARKRCSVGINNDPPVLREDDQALPINEEVKRIFALQTFPNKSKVIACTLPRMLNYGRDE